MMGSRRTHAFRGRAVGPFSQIGRSCGYRANSAIMNHIVKRKNSKFSEDIVIGSPGVIPATIN